MFNLFNSRPAAGGSQLAVTDAVEQVAAGTLTLIDVRDGNELAQTGKAEGAVHLPLISFQMKTDPRSPEVLPELGLDKPVAIYCATGARSQMAARMMMQMGYQTVHNLGGLNHWAGAGGKVVRA